MSSAFKVVSLVPSWTETLLEAGVQVLGRTRFCIHPEKSISTLPVVGGTKDLKIEEILNIKPDFVLLDREENTKEMAEVLAENKIQLLITHVRDLKSLAKDLFLLGETLGSDKLSEWGYRAQYFANHPLTKKKSTREIFQTLFEKKIFEDAVGRGTQDQDSFLPVTYLIWKKPWMCVREGTYIASLLEHLGFSIYAWPEFEKTKTLYPELNLSKEKFESNPSFFLFSSEPFPFRKFKKEFDSFEFQGAIVDGECFSWFGVRSLRFLSELHQLDWKF